MRRISRWWLAYWIVALGDVVWILLPHFGTPHPSESMWPYGDQLFGAGLAILYFAGIYVGIANASVGHHSPAPFVLSGLYCLIGVGLLTLSQFQADSESARKAREIRVTGTVADVEKSPDGTDYWVDQTSGAHFYQLKVDFVARDTKETNSFYATDEAGRTHPRGSLIDVVFDSATGESELFSGELFPRPAPASWPLGAAFLIPGLAMATVKVVNRRRTGTPG
ncbi:MAG: hypothetical protein ACHQ50_05495 [Fimbriimonadales bacterium]